VHRPWRPIVQTCAVAAVAAVLNCDPAVAQTNGCGGSSAGMGTTSPLSLGSGFTAQPVGIPLGSTEIATSGISPAAPPSGVGLNVENTNSSDSRSSKVRPSGASFDGGGISGSASSSCVTTATTNSAGTSNPSAATSSAGRVGIPLGSTELGGAGLSSVVSSTCRDRIPYRFVSIERRHPMHGRSRVYNNGHRRLLKNCHK
jgi:hypothetical protein